MQNVNLVQSFESPCHLDECLPDFSLVEVSPMAGVIIDLLLNIACVGKFHHHAESLGAVVEESVSVVDDVGVGDRGKDADFVKSVLFLFLAHLSNFDLSQTRDTFFMA